MILRSGTYSLIRITPWFKTGLLCLGLTVAGALSAEAAPAVTINFSPAPAPINVQLGQTVIFILSASDVDLGATTVTLSSAALPAGALTTLPLPFTAPSSLSCLFFWTPTASQLGTTVLTFFATDNLGGQAAASLSVFVNRPPAANCQAATLVAGVDCQAWLLPSLIDNGSFDPDGDPISLAVSDGSNPTPAPSLTLSGLGDHKVTLTVSDNHGGSSTCTATVTVVDQTPPVITVLGDNPAIVDCHASYVDPGATAHDNCAGDVPVSSSGSADPNTPGNYIILYTASDPSGNTATAVRTVTVVDSTPPVITLQGTSPATVECHTSYTDPGATAIDACSGPVITTITGTVDVNTPGVYTILYSAKDPTGNRSTATRIVNVVDSTPPVVTLLGASPATVECHTKYTDPGATATDTCAGSLPLTTTGTVDANTPGTYIISYGVSDPSGNTALATRTVNVVDSIPPIITASGTPADGALGCNPTPAAIEAALGTATVSDACGTPTLTFSTSSILSTSNCGRSQTRTWQATDPSGNPTIASRTVTWTEDTTPPVLVCPPDITVTCTSSTDPKVTGTATATDDCGTVSISYSDSGSLSCQSPFGTITRTWTAVDGCGNASTCMQNIQTLSSSPQVTSSITSGFNSTSISTANWIWFNANFSAKHIPANGATISFKNSNIAITSAQGSFAFPVQDGRIVFSPSAACATTLFDGTQWVTMVPLSGSDEILLSALGIAAPADLKAATVTWTGEFSSDTPGVSLAWKWSAAVYTTDITQAQYNNLGVKPTHTAACLYKNSDHAGTPEVVKASVIGGARGGGGANYTGGWTGTASVICP